MSKRVIIIGGGISGLSAAYSLFECSREKKIPLEVSLLEASDRVGGVIQTFQRQGFLMEGGPDSFLSKKPWAVNLCKKLGIDKDIIGTNPSFRRSFIHLNGKLSSIPEGLYLIAPTRLKTLLSMDLMSIRGKIRMASEMLIPPHKTNGDESVAHFIRRRLGREAFEKIGQPMISGIYTADPEKLSLRATFPLFLEMEQEHGSILKALMVKKIKEKTEDERKASGPRYSLFLSLRNGIQQLTEALVAQMPDLDLQLSSRVRGIHRTHKWRVELDSGKNLEADAICLAVPAYEACRLVAPFSSELAGPLSKISYESVATVNAAFERSKIGHALNGFGFIVPAREKKNILACTFSSIKYAGRAPQDFVLLRAFVGGALQRHAMEWDESRLKELCVAEMKKSLGISGEPLFVEVHRSSRSMPQYHVGHLGTVAEIQAHVSFYPGLFLAGNAYHGVGIPDCIRTAERAAEQMMHFLGVN